MNILGLQLSDCDEVYENGEALIKGIHSEGKYPVAFITKDLRIVLMMLPPLDYLEVARGGAIDVNGTVIIDSGEPCYCCGSYRIRPMQNDSQAYCHQHDENPANGPVCKYAKNKDCKPDGACGGKDSFETKSPVEAMDLPTLVSAKEHCEATLTLDESVGGGTKKVNITICLLEPAPPKGIEK